MAVYDTLNIEVIEGGLYAVSLHLTTPDPQLVLGAVQGLLAQEVVRSGTLWEDNTQEGESGTEAEPDDAEDHDPEYEEDIPEPRASGREYTNLEKLNNYFYEGRIRDGDSWKPFGPKDWQEGFERFCQNIPQEEGELIRGQYLAQRREEESGEHGFE